MAEMTLCGTCGKRIFDLNAPQPYEPGAMCECLITNSAPNTTTPPLTPAAVPELVEICRTILLGPYGMPAHCTLFGKRTNAGNDGRADQPPAREPESPKTMAEVSPHTLDPSGQLP